MLVVHLLCRGGQNSKRVTEQNKQMFENIISLCAHIFRMAGLLSDGNMVESGFLRKAPGKAATLGSALLFQELLFLLRVTRLMSQRMDLPSKHAPTLEREHQRKRTPATISSQVGVLYPGLLHAAVAFPSDHGIVLEVHLHLLQGCKECEFLKLISSMNEL